MTGKEICQQENCMQFIEFAEEIYGLEFDEEPNYHKLRFLLTK